MCWALIFDHKFGSDGIQHLRNFFLNASWQVKVAHVFLVTSNEGRNPIGRFTEFLTLKEFRVGERGEMFDLGEQPRWNTRFLNIELGSQRATNLFGGRIFFLGRPSEPFWMCQAPKRWVVFSEATSPIVLVTPVEYDLRKTTGRATVSNPDLRDQ